MTFVNDTRTGFNSTLTYTVDGDKVLKQSGHNVYDPEALDTTAETLKAFVEKLIMDIKASKGVTHSIKIKDGKVVQDVEVDFTVASLDELKSNAE